MSSNDKAAEKIITAAMGAAVALTGAVTDAGKAELERDTKNYAQSQLLESKSRDIEQKNS